MIIKQSEVLVTQDASGKNRYWQMFVDKDNEDGEVFTHTEYWSEGGVHTDSALTQVFGKNIGHSNETTPEEQAIKELESAVQRQTDQGYYPVGGERQLVYDLPMLAHDLTKRKKPLEFPVWAQPKIDGMRMLWSKDKGFWTRGGKAMIEAVTAHIRVPAEDLGDLVLDGELVLPTPYSFQDTMSAAKRFNKETSPQLMYNIFDFYLPQNMDVPAYARMPFVSELGFDGATGVVSVLIQSMEELTAFHGCCIEMGYEGTIVRTPDGQYEIGRRSHNLLKYKNFDETDFHIIDVIDGKGKEEGVASFVLTTPNLQTFKSSINMSLEERKKIFDNREAYIRRTAKVKHQGYSDDGVPRFPKVLAIREDIEG